MDKQNIDNVNCKENGRRHVPKKNTMVFIDAENISPEKTEKIQESLSKIGKVKEVGYYAMQKDAYTARWRKKAAKYNYKSHLLSGARTKNKVDNEIIKDAKKILDTDKSIDIFCIVTSDGDYTGLVNELREKGKRVVIMSNARYTSQKLIDASSTNIPI